MIQTKSNWNFWLPRTKFFSWTLHSTNFLVVKKWIEKLIDFHPCFRFSVPHFAENCFGYWQIDDFSTHISPWLMNWFVASKSSSEVFYLCWTFPLKLCTFGGALDLKLIDFQLWIGSTTVQEFQKSNQFWYNSFENNFSQKLQVWLFSRRSHSRDFFPRNNVEVINSVLCVGR